MDKKKKVEKVHFICDSPYQEYHIHETIIGEDITGLPAKVINVIDSDVEGVKVNINIKDDSERVVIDQLLQLREFLTRNEMDFTIQNMNKVLGHTGFKFREDIEIPREFVNMSKEEILLYHVNVPEEDKENWKSLFIETLKYVVYTQAIGTNYSEYYGDNVYENFPVFYRMEDFDSFRDLVDMVMVNLIDTSVLINCIESITVFKKFKSRIPLESYTIFKGDAEDIENYDELITSNATIVVKQRYSETGSVEGAKYKITRYDDIAHRQVPKNLLYFILEMDEKPISNKKDYIATKLAKMDYFDFMMRLVKPIRDELTIQGAPVNEDLINKIHITGIIEKPELKKPEIKWDEISQEPIQVEEDGVIIDYIDETMNMKNLKITIEPYQKQVLQYDSVKSKIKFYRFSEILDTKDFDKLIPELEDVEIEEYLEECKYLGKDETNLAIDGNANVPTAKIRVWQETMLNVLNTCIDRILKVRTLLEKNAAELADKFGKDSIEEMTEEQKQEFQEKAKRLDQIVSDALRMININTIQYDEDSLVYDLTKLATSSPQSTKMFRYIKTKVINSEKIWDGLKDTFKDAEVLGDNKQIFLNLIKEICASSLVDILRLNSDNFKYLLNEYVNGRTDFVKTCTEMNRYVIAICLKAVEE